MRWVEVRRRARCRVRELTPLQLPTTAQYRELSRVEQSLRPSVMRIIR